MGRGRAKAKQTKVARDLKYSSPSTDFKSLQEELSGHSAGSAPGLSGSAAPAAQRGGSGNDSKQEYEEYEDWRR